MIFYIVLTPIYTTSGLRSTGNTRTYQQIDVYIYQCGIQHEIQVGICVQRRFSSICVFAQSDVQAELSLRWAHSLLERGSNDVVNREY